MSLFSDQMLGAIAQAGSALALIEAVVIVVLWRQIQDLRARIEQLHEYRLAEIGKSLEALASNRELAESFEELTDVVKRLGERGGKR